MADEITKLRVIHSRIDSVLCEAATAPTQPADLAEDRAAQRSRIHRALQDQANAIASRFEPGGSRA